MYHILYLCNMWKTVKVIIIFYFIRCYIVFKLADEVESSVRLGECERSPGVGVVVHLEELPVRGTSRQSSIISIRASWRLFWRCWELDLHPKQDQVELNLPLHHGDEVRALARVSRNQLTEGADRELSGGTIVTIVTSEQVARAEPGKLLDINYRHTH